MKTLARPGDRAELLRRLKAIQPTTPAAWGRMSAHQMICHLCDTSCMMLGTRQVTPVTGLMQRTIIKWISLYAPVDWPEGVPTTPETDQEIAGTKPSEFARDVAVLEALVEQLIAPRTSAWPPHPIFGAMSERAWMRWAYRHMDHHLRQFGA
jgi:hypothetical protein